MNKHWLTAFLITINTFSAVLSYEKHRIVSALCAAVVMLVMFAELREKP